MSVVAVRKYKDKIIIAANTIRLRGDLKTKGTKLKHINDMYIGCVGNYSDFNSMFLYAKDHKPTANTELGIAQFLADYLKWQKELFNGVEFDSQFIIVYHNKCYLASNCISEEIVDYWAIGYAQAYATCAMHLDKDPIEAVKICCELCNSVSEPIDSFTISIDNSKNNE